MKGTLLLYGGGFVSVNLCRTGWELQKKNPFIGKLKYVAIKNTQRKVYLLIKRIYRTKSGFKTTLNRLRHIFHVSVSKEKT